jgi:hypothetical protein
MSMIAGGKVVPVDVLPKLLEAAGRKQGMFHFGRPAFDKVLDKSGRLLPTYDGRGENAMLKYIELKTNQ